MTEYKPPLLCNSQEMIQELFDEINGYLEEQVKAAPLSTKDSNDTDLSENSDRGRWTSTCAGAAALLDQYDYSSYSDTAQPTLQPEVPLKNDDRLRYRLDDLALDEPVEDTQSSSCNYKMTTGSPWNDNTLHNQYSDQDDGYSNDDTGDFMPPTQTTPSNGFDVNQHIDDVLGTPPDESQHLMDGLPLLTTAHRIGEPHTVALRTNMARGVGSYEDRINAYNNAYSHCIMAGTDLVPWIKKQYTKGPPDLIMGYTPQSRRPSKARFSFFKRYSRSVNPLVQSITIPSSSCTNVSKSSGSNVSSPILSLQSSQIQHTSIDQPCLPLNNKNDHAPYDDTSFMQNQGPPSPIPSSSSSLSKRRSASSLNIKSPTPMALNDSKQSWTSSSNDLSVSILHQQRTHSVSPYCRRSHNQRQETQNRKQYPWYQPAPSWHPIPPDQDQHFNIRPHRSTSNIGMQSFSYIIPYSSHDGTQNRTLYRARSSDLLDPRAYDHTVEIRRRQRLSAPPTTYHHPISDFIPSRPRQLYGSTPGCSIRSAIRRRSTGNDDRARYDSDYGYLAKQYPKAKHNRHKQPNLTALDGLGAFFPHMPKHALALYLQEAQGDFYLAKDLCVEDIMTGRV